MPVLSGGGSVFAGDNGSADPRVAAALKAFGAGTGSEHAALTALAGSRLLIPIVAAGGGDLAEMSLPTLIGHDGRAAIPAFTCLDTLARWQPLARPAPASAGQLWRAAVADACAVVVDVAGPVPLAVEGARLAALAGGRAVPQPHEDPDVVAVVRGAAARYPAITAVDVTPGESDLRVVLTLAVGCPPAVGQEALRELAQTLLADLGARLRRGIEIAVSRAAGSRGT